MTSESNRGEVHLTKVSRSFSGVPAVENLDLTVRAGEFLSLLGPSGCGKTTTLRMLAGFERPDTGSITISGARVEHLPPNRRDVNTVFQSYALFPHMDVASNVAYGLRQRGIARNDVNKRVGEALELVQMTTFARRKPDKLSGGQQQRVALARAIVNRPSVLLLDEPLAALDRQLREQMQIDLKLLQSELGMTFIFVTHDQGEAMAMSDRIAVMCRGRIEQLGAPTEIYDSPSTPFVANFIGQQNFLSGVVEPDGTTVKGSNWSLRVEPKSTVQPGSAVTLAVRPESIRLSTNAPADGNALGGRVLTAANLGLHVRYVIRLESGQELIAVSARSDESLRPNDAIQCAVDPQRVVLFPATNDAELPHPELSLSVLPRDRSHT